MRVGRKKNSDPTPGLAAAAAGAATGAAVGGVPGALIGAGTQIAVKGSLGSLLHRLEGRREERVHRVLRQAAKRAGISTEELCYKLEESPVGERLLIDTLLAAQDEAVEEKLFALAESLAAGATSDDGLSATVERLLVAAIQDLSLEHLTLLAKFNRNGKYWSQRERREFVHRVELTRADLLAAVLPEWEQQMYLDAFLASLQRHGLIEHSPTRYSTTDYPSVLNEACWAITWLGVTLLTRMNAIGALLKSAGKESP